MPPKTLLAVDIGASSGRVVAGKFDGERITVDEVFRFPNGPVPVAGTLYWDVLAQWHGVLDGLRAAAQQTREVVSVGVDTWGVDFALLAGDQLLGNPVHYRDKRTAGMIELGCSRVPREEIFATTGLQFLPFNTLFQLLALRESRSPLLEAADALLLMPDLFHWMLTGEKSNELTNASTTQFFDPRSRSWAHDLLKRFEIPSAFLGTIVEPGTRLGPLRADVAEATGLDGVEVVLPGTHDTASAVMAVPATNAPSATPNWAYISSGTWSLAGVEVPRPVLDDRCLQFNFTNEGGVGGTTRLLKNIAGLWLVQESRRIWAEAGRDYDWAELVARADAAPPRQSFVDPDAQDFLAPRDMPEAIRTYCRRTRQTVPDDEGAMTRCALESIALKSRYVLSQAAELTGAALDTVHIVGGGSQNSALCQATADACGLRVLAGPTEATAIGNLMMQAVALGDVGSIIEAREVIQRSFPCDEYLPHDADEWDAAFARFSELISAETS